MPEYIFSSYFSLCDFEKNKTFMSTEYVNAPLLGNSRKKLFQSLTPLRLTQAAKGDASLI